MTRRWLTIVAVCAVLIVATWWCLLQDRPAPVVAAPERVRPATRLHVLTAGDSVQVGGVKGEIVKCCIVPHGKMVVVEIQTKPAKAGKEKR